jgi:hypothetical protein
MWRRHDRFLSRLAHHRRRDLDGLLGGSVRFSTGVDSKIAGKKSQSIRFAPEAIRELKEILASHFAK